MRGIRRGLWGLLLPAMPALAQVPVAPEYLNPELRAIGTRLLQASATQPVASPLRRPSRPADLPPGVEEETVPAKAGHPPVTVYIVNRSAQQSAQRGAILYIHGGGFMAGSARGSVRAVLGLAARLNCVVVSVEYRLAPETRFPGALEDNYAALKWLHDNAGSLGVDPKRIAVMGESAGGGHAAMLTIAARDRKEVPIAFQALVYPMLDDRTGSTHKVDRTIGTLVWRPQDNRAGWTALLGKPAGSRTVPPGSVPAREENLRGLPPTFIGVGSIDLFAEEDIEFARRLVGQGVPTELLVVPGAFHGFQTMVPQAAVSRQFNGALEAALMRAVGSPTTP
ncbi:alpha/beta hydrolase [Sphingobium tyrosinilyticum]|uniref:Alpha/beta hydrolase n=1 Tax=Sphingobium tyrosinilyticum TaxID=2715436 RepID=A0ABV9F3C8_9SPHN